MKITRLNESVEHPYMFQYSCNNSTFGYDFQRYAQELGANRMYDHTQKGGGLHFYTVPSEDVYNKLKEVAKKRFTVDMYPLRPFDRDKYANAKIQESMTIAYDEDTIKNMINRIQRNLEDYKSLLTEFPEDREYWKEMIRKCELEIAELESYTPLNESQELSPIQVDGEPAQYDVSIVEEPRITLSHEIAEELDKYLRSQKIFAEELYYNSMDKRIEYDINRGDWKHEHLRSMWLVRDFFEERNIKIHIDSWTTEEDGSDNYSAHYVID